MSVVRKDVTIDFANPRQKALREWLSVNAHAAELPPLTINVAINVGKDDVDPDEIEEWFAELFPVDTTDWLERVYRYLAEGDCTAAMDLLAREFDLPPPSHARAIADLISGNRTSRHAAN